MARNRSLNGADVSLGDHGDEAGPGGRPTQFGNDLDLGSPESLTFHPDLSTPEAINTFYRSITSERSSGTDSSHPYLQHMPLGTV